MSKVCKKWPPRNRRRRRRRSFSGKSRPELLDRGRERERRKKIASSRLKMIQLAKASQLVSQPTKLAELASYVSISRLVETATDLVMRTSASKRERETG